MLLSRRLRREADVGDDARSDDDAPARRGIANRISAAHQSDFVMRRTPPRHPPKGPPKVRQCRSQRRAAGLFETPLDRVARILTKPSREPDGDSRRCTGDHTGRRSAVCALIGPVGDDGREDSARRHVEP